MHAYKPFSQACENNKTPILNVLTTAFANVRRVLEIGSGTGQHAVHFARHLPHLVWQTSDVQSNHAGIRAWLDDARLANARPPVALDVSARVWPRIEADAVFSANTAHIMHWSDVEAMFAGLTRVLGPDGLLALYGPFAYGGAHTSDSNARFDASLRAQDSGMGVRDFEAVDALAGAAGLALAQDCAMPANNRLLLWKQGTSEGAVDS